MTQPKRIPSVRTGTVIHLPAEVRHWYDDAPLLMQVREVRLDLVSAHDIDYSYVWVDGFVVDERGQASQRWQELIDIDVLTRVAQDGTCDRPCERRSGPTLD